MKHNDRIKGKNRKIHHTRDFNTHYISQDSLKKQMCVCKHVYKEIYFKKLAGAAVGAGKSEIYRTGLQIGNSGRT